MLRVSEIQICLKVRLFFFLQSWRSLGGGLGLAGERAWRGGARPAARPSLRNKYIHHCTNILIQKQHCPECSHRLCR